MKSVPVIGAIKSALSVAALSLALAGCVASGPQAKDYSDFRTENPKSILVLPALNNSGAVEAPEFFLSTVSQPFAQRGHYVFPANMVKSLLEDEGLSDPALLYGADTRRLDRMFGCDTALYLTIERWESQYVVLATSTNVTFTYDLRSCKSGESVWIHTQQLTYSPQASSSDNPLADLLAQAIISAIEKGSPNYIPLARQANALAAGTVGQGIPAGPYLPDLYQQDTEQFPVSVTAAAE